MPLKMAWTSLKYNHLKHWQRLKPPLKARYEWLVRNSVKSGMCCITYLGIFAGCRASLSGLTKIAHHMLISCPHDSDFPPTFKNTIGLDQICCKALQSGMRVGVCNHYMWIYVIRLQQHLGGKLQVQETQLLVIAVATWCADLPKHSRRRQGTLLVAKAVFSRMRKHQSQVIHQETVPALRLDALQDWFCNVANCYWLLMSRQFFCI